MKLSDFKKSALFVGRFQPLHKGHARIILDALKKYEEVVVAIVRGDESSKDNDRNPFNKKEQLAMFKTLFGDSVRVIVEKNGFIPSIIAANKLKTTHVLAGKDRISGYEKMITATADTSFEDACKNIACVETPRITSGTDVRTAIADNDLATFKKLMPLKLHYLWGDE